MIVNPNGDRALGGDVVVSAELSNPGTQYLVVANTAEAAAGPTSYTGTHPVGEALTVKGRSAPSEPAFVEIRDVMPAEVLVLLRA